MPGGASSARLFEERLVVVQPHGRHLEQIGGDLGEALGEDEPRDRLVLRPDVGNLEERLPVRPTLFERTRLAVVEERRVLDHGPVRVDLLGRTDAAQYDVTVAPVVLDRLRIEVVQGVERGQRRRVGHQSIRN
jgi:hypothetical protein